MNKHSLEPNHLPYIIQKEHGRIILAYRAFDDFLNSEKTWTQYESLLLNTYPEMQYIHNTQLNWGTIETETFPEVVQQYKREDFEERILLYDKLPLPKFYDEMTRQAYQVLPPINDTPIDVCFFLPYGGCFVHFEGEQSIICISLWISPDQLQQVMLHEYAHCLHQQRCPEEPLTLRRELLREGLAIYLTTLFSDLPLQASVPFMSAADVDWCLEHEDQIRSTIFPDLEENGMHIFARYISDGEMADPPDGFVEKTAYLLGYKIIAKCIEKGMSIEDVCRLDSKTLIEKSSYFSLM